MAAQTSALQSLFAERLDTHQARSTQDATSSQRVWFLQGMGLAALMLVGVYSVVGLTHHDGSLWSSGHDAALAFHPAVPGMKTRGGLRSTARDPVFVAMNAGQDFGAGEAASVAGVRADAGAQPPLVVVGAGVLGRLAARQWQELHRGGSEVMGVTRTRPDESREAEMRAEGITHRYCSDIEAAVRCGRRWPHVLFSASPSGNDDYVAAVVGAIEYWDKDAPDARFVFTSSAGVFAEQDGGVVTETSPVGSGPRSERLLAAERAVLDAGGCVVRLAGLYLEDRGAHNYWLTQDEIAQRPDGLINQVHYRDAAGAAVAALLRGKRGAVYVAADDSSLTREQICAEALRAPRFAGRAAPVFTGSDGGVGKVVDCSASRAALGWHPEYPTFGAFVDTLV